TNQQNWDRWEWQRNPTTGVFDYRQAIGGDPNWSRVAIAGAIAPCATTRPEIAGLVCRDSGPPTAASFFTLTPCRLIDTRDPDGPLGGPSLAASRTRNFSAAGHCGIPLDATSIAANLVIVQPTAGPSYLTVYPGDITRPLTSTINANTG